MLINKKYTIILVAVCWMLIFSTSCRTTRNIIVREVKPMSVGKIIRKVAKETPSYTTYETKKVTINYENDDAKNTFSGQLKINRNECIILSLKKMTMPIGKGYITDDSLTFVNYIDKYFIQDDINSMKEVFGVNVSYVMFQALLTADVSNLLDDENLDKELTSIIDDKMYRIDSQFKGKIYKAINSNNVRKLNRFMEKMDDSEFINYTVWVDPEFFIIRKLTLKNIKSKENITINYDQFEVAGHSLFPQNISFDFNSEKQNLKVELKLTKPTVNKTDNFSFNIPKKYEKFYFSKN